MKSAHNKSFNLPILMYHHLEPGAVAPTEYSISVGAFAAQLDALRRGGFTALSFKDLFEIAAGVRSLPRKPAIITFDDAYKSFLELALPALAARRMSATLFVIAGEIGGFNRWDVERAIPKRALMDEQDIRAAVSAGTEIGAHGWAHWDLCLCSGEELRQEIFESKKTIERRFGVPVEVFSYPYGSYARPHFALLQEAGYKGAVSIFSNERAVTSNLFAMRRIYIHPNDGPLRFRLKLSQLYLRYVARRDAKRIVISD